jgi:hypothetical protein
MTENDAWMTHGLQRVPRRDHFRRRIRTELEVQSVHRRRSEGIGRAACDDRRIRFGAAGKRRRNRGDARGGEQFPPAQFESTFVVGRDHRGDYSVRCARLFLGARSVR